MRLPLQSLLAFSMLALAGSALAIDLRDQRFSHTVYLQPYSKLRQAAELGDPEAQYDLAYLYYKADSDPAVSGLAQSDSRAAYWYRKAAQQGHARAQFNMAVLHLRGHGVDRDPVEAYAWLLQSAAQGHEGSGDLLRELDAILNARQTAEARERSTGLGVARPDPCCESASVP